MWRLALTAVALQRWLIAEAHSWNTILLENLLNSADFPVQEEVEQQVTQGEAMEDALAAKTQAVEELSRELEEIRAAFGTEGVQQVNVVVLRIGHTVSYSSVD